MKMKNESGIALIAVLLLLVLAGALLEGFIVTLNSDQKNLGSYLVESKTMSRSQGMVKRVADELAAAINAGRLNGDGSISDEMVEDIASRALSGSGLNESVQNISITQKVGSEAAKPRTLGANAGTFAGMTAIVHSYIIAVTGHDSSTGKEIKYEQEIQIVYIPAFQFGMFSDSDLAFFAGNTFDFGGRVHTNGNLFLGGSITIRDYASAAGSIIRGTKPNRLVTADSTDRFKITVHPGTGSTDNNTDPIGNRDGNGDVRIRSLQNGTLMSLAKNEGNDSVGKYGSAWKAIYNRFNGYLSNGDPRASTVPAKTLNLPLVTSDAQPVDLIRRPAINENNTDSALFEQRYFTSASLRILLSDEKDHIKRLPTIVSPDPVLMEGAYPTASPKYKFAESAFASDYKKNGTNTAAAGAPLIGGYIKIEMQKKENDTISWIDVTDEILQLGVHGKAMTGSCNRAQDDAPNAVIRVQRFADNITKTTGCDATTMTGTDTAKYWPDVLFDTREAVDNDSYQYPGNSSANAGRLLLGGIMHYVELDIANLGKWLRESTNGRRALVYDGGYVVYFSDRRGSGNNPTYNYDNAYDKDNNRVDLNGDGLYSTAPVEAMGYGDYTLNVVTTPAASATFSPKPAPFNSTDVTTPMAGISADLAKRIRPIYFRRALKLSNGSKINLGSHTVKINNKNVDIPYGLSIASENPVYIQGNYNATKQADLTTPLEVTGGDWTSVPASIVADAVTMLSKDWTDKKSFDSPYVNTGRRATDTFYRVALISGKNKNFVTNVKDYGTDGGAHNFFRMIENWKDSSGNAKNFWYRGSIVSLYYSQEAMSSFKSNQGNVYDVPVRQFSFDTEFLTFEKLPPRTPMFRDINELGFTRVTKAD
jgi:hypothetical protein